MKTLCLLLMAMIVPLTLMGKEKVEVRNDGVVLMTHGEEHFKDHLSALKAETLVKLENTAADLKKMRQTKDVLLKRRQISKTMDRVGSFDLRYFPISLKNMPIGEHGYILMNGSGSPGQEVAVRVIDVAGEDEFIGVIIIAKTHFGIDGITEESGPIWFRGYTTEKLTDDTRIYLTGLYTVTETKKYKNIAGGSNTVKVVEPWEPEKVEAAK